MQLMGFKTWNVTSTILWITVQFHRRWSFFMSSWLVTHLVKKFPAFYRTWGLVIKFVKVCHYILSCDHFILSILAYPTAVRSPLILFFNLMFRSLKWPSAFTLYGKKYHKHYSLPLWPLYVPIFWLVHPKNIW